MLKAIGCTIIMVVAYLMTFIFYTMKFMAIISGVILVLLIILFFIAKKLGKITDLDI